MLRALAVLALAATAAAREANPTPQSVSVTEADVAASNEKVRMAFADLAQTWSTDFRRIGARFATPRLVRYRGAARTGCGIIRPQNAEYCPAENTVYFDEVFVAGLAKSAAEQLGTDGDMAAVGVIAHEMGHAVAMQLGDVSRIPYENEATADCLAGAFAKHARESGELEKGDLEEAFYGMSTAGDPTPELTGDARLDTRILRVASMTGHGTRQQRMDNFRAGLDGGAGACLEEFR